MNYFVIRMVVAVIAVFFLIQCLTWGDNNV